MAEYDKTEGYVVHIMDRTGGDHEKEFRDVEFLDTGWIRCVDPPHGDQLEDGEVIVSYYPPQRVADVAVYEKP
jgi:hypothetical protein